MFAKTVLTDEERAVDCQLGYPRGYSKLCRHAYIQMQGLITPYTEGPPQKFHPYAPQEEEMNKLKEFDGLFPYVADEERDPANARRHSEFLWQQLDHLGNAGFDPAKFRVDMYGNVVYWHADPGSPLAWEVDHWFPHSRGGKTVVSNLRIVQWQVNQRKGTKLEFLVPWWDLQIGISVNQFLSVFSSRNADFRQRAFALFFQCGENEQLDEKLAVECHSWPQHFRERKHRVGLAAAAIVKVQKAVDDSTLRIVNGTTTKQSAACQAVGTGTPARRRWTIDEEEALKRAVQKFGPGNWKDIKEFEPVLVNRSTVQIKDKYRLMKGDWKQGKENSNTAERCSSGVATAIQREERMKLAREEEKKQKQEEVARLEEDLKQLKEHNEKEKSVMEELEETLASERKRVEKQRKWSETQSQYRLCLEKMIRDTMHQCVVYKEQARLNQAACNALVARLESLKLACDAAEMDLLKRVNHRESLEAMARPKIIKRTRNDGHADVSGCIKADGIRHKSHEEREWIRLFNVSSEPSLDTTTSGTENEEIPLDSCVKEAATSNETIGEGEADDARHQFVKQGGDSPTASATSSGVKRKTLERTEMEMFLFEDEVAAAEAQGRNEHEGEESTGDSEEGANRRRRRRSKDDEQLDELLRDVLEMKGRVDAAMADAVGGEEDEEDRIKRMGKVNLDKWLKMLLLNPGECPSEGVDAAAAAAAGTCDSSGKVGDRSDDVDEKNSSTRIIRKKPIAQQAGEDEEEEEGGGTAMAAAETARGVSVLGGLLKKLSLKQQQQPGHEDEDHHGGGAECHDEKEDASKKKNKGAEDKQQLQPAAFHDGWSHEKRRASLSPWRRRASTTTSPSPLFKRASSVSSSKCRDGGGGACKKLYDGDEAPKQKKKQEEDTEVAFQIACESEFVEKMRARREREQRMKRYRQLGIPPRLQDLLAESSSSLPSPSQQEATTTTTTTTTASNAEQDPDSPEKKRTGVKEEKEQQQQGSPPSKRHEEEEDREEQQQQIWLPEVKQWEVFYQGRARRRRQRGGGGAAAEGARRGISNSSSPQRQRVAAARSFSTSPGWAQGTTEGNHGRRRSMFQTITPVKKKVCEAERGTKMSCGKSPFLDRTRTQGRWERSMAAPEMTMIAGDGVAEEETAANMATTTTHLLLSETQRRWRGRSSGADKSRAGEGTTTTTEAAKEEEAAEEEEEEAEAEAEAEGEAAGRGGVGTAATSSATAAALAATSSAAAAASSKRLLFFQDWDAAAADNNNNNINELSSSSSAGGGGGFRASLSQVWRKTVKRLELVRQLPPA